MVTDGAIAMITKGLRVKGLRTKGLQVKERELRMTILTAATVTAALTMTSGRGTSDEETRGRGGSDVASVALLIPNPSPGDYSALNPTVGIEAI